MKLSFNQPRRGWYTYDKIPDKLFADKNIQSC